MKPPFSILFEDPQIIAVNKPSGLPSHSLTHEPSVESELALFHSQQAATKRIFLLHRLDTGTSGVLLFAKNQAVFDQMREKFKHRELEKIYWAWSAINEERRTRASRFIFPLELHSPLAHHPKSKKRMIVLPEGKKRSYRGKPLPAQTRVLSMEEEKWMGLDSFRLQVQIITGVMHQIRVHLLDLGFPLLGDPIYNPEEPAPRLGLHAQSVRFELNGHLYQIEAPAP